MTPYGARAIKVLPVLIPKKCLNWIYDNFGPGADMGETAKKYAIKSIWAAFVCCLIEIYYSVVMAIIEWMRV